MLPFEGSRQEDASRQAADAADAPPQPAPEGDAAPPQATPAPVPANDPPIAADPPTAVPAPLASPATVMDSSKPPAPDGGDAVAKVDVSKPAVAKAPGAKAANRALTVRQYLESTVVPTLMAGMQTLVKERPDDPVAFLAEYLLTNNPKKKDEEAKPPAP